MNKAILMGRLTKDPEVRYSQSNLAICSYTLAIDRRFSRQGEEKQADFIPIVTFGKTAEFCEKYFRKGQQVAVSGRIQTRTWDDNEGKRRYVTEVIGEDVYFADSKRADNGADYGGRPEDYGYYPQLNSGAPADMADMPDIGDPGVASGRAAGGAKGQDGAETDDGFMPVESENDLPF